MEKTFLFMIHSTSLRTCLIITIAYFSVAFHEKAVQV